MASNTLTARIQLKNDTAANWTSNNPVLLKGELGLEIDTLKFKFGDGVSTWSNLSYASQQSAILNTASPQPTDYNYPVGSIWINTGSNTAFLLYNNTASAAVWKQIITPDDLSDLGAGDMLKAQFANNEKAEQGYVNAAIMADTATLADSAEQLTTGQTISVHGDATGTSQAFNGTASVSIPIALAESGVTSGQYTKVTVNEKGIVTSGTDLTASDIPNITLSKISDAGTVASLDTGISSGNVPVVGENGKLNEAIIPAVAITDTFVVASQSAMLDLNAQQGDIAIRTDINKSFVLSKTPASTLSNWVELLTPTDAVSSVNGMQGEVVLTTSNISEGSNLYFTTARANENWVTHASTELTDSSTLLRTTDTFILNGGNSTQ